MLLNAFGWWKVSQIPYIASLASSGRTVGSERRDQLCGAVPVLGSETLRPATRISTLKARIHAGNSNSTQGEKPTPTSSTSAATVPATVSHLDTIWVRRAIVTVVGGNTAAIRIA